MNYYRDLISGAVFAYASQEERDRYGAHGLQPMTEEELQAHLNPAPPPPSVPPYVTRFQARAALHLGGLLPQVEALMSHPDTPVLAKLAWADAQDFKRTSPTIASMAGALGLTDEQLDALFTTAAGIDA